MRHWIFGMPASTTSIACIAIYARFHRHNGEFLSQLTFGKSTSVPSELSQTRAKLLAILLNTYAWEVTKHEFRNKYKRNIKFTVSQFVFNWINNGNLPLKQWVCNHIIEIRTLTDLLQWKYNNKYQWIK